MMRRAQVVLAIAAALACASLPSSVAADATLLVESADGPGEGFNDPTSVTPVGGNTGTTRGAQRMIALQHAANLWGAVLDSDVPIVIRATFDAFACTGSATTLATASAAGLLQGIDDEGANPAFGYPDALANRLLGSDFAPDEPEIVATFNSAVDAGCLPGTQWYYGLDAQHGVDQDMVNVALHELGHGLGIQAFVDADTGQHTLGFPSVYSSHVLDLDAALHWSDMNDAQRLASYSNVRRVAWDGVHAAEAAADWLLPGRPEIQVTPDIAGFTGLASDASYGAVPSSSVSATLVTSISGCPTGSAGSIVLLRDTCATSSRSAMAEDAGVVGVLVVSEATLWTSPPAPHDEDDPESVGIPVLAISPEDAELLEDADQAGTVMVSISFAAGLRGGDDQGRVLLNATDPATGSSSISHWDELARPDLLMEPLHKDVNSHELDITPALLADLGWVPLCGNDRVDLDEECDEGDDNSDSIPDACRTDCAEPRCGDGVHDEASGEGCDDGDGNSDDTPDACRTSCEPAACGDGVRDEDETCDDGGDNSDAAPDACRTDCSPSRCGDGVRDEGEGCDDGDDNDDNTPDACRNDCTLPRCGDGVRDARAGEGCDNGSDNSDSAPDACRTSCEPATCGDGVRDQDEGCDQGSDNSDEKADACRASCEPARCGDGVRDQGESCDDGEQNSDSEPDACRTSCQPAGCGDGVVDRGERCELATSGDCVTGCPSAVDDAGTPPDAAPAPQDAGPVENAPSDDGCGCRLAPRAASTPTLPLWLGALAWSLRRLSSAARRHGTRGVSALTPRAP